MEEEQKKIGENPELSRLTGKTLFSDILSIINFERGVFYTLKGLVLRPYKTINEYLKVDRRKHANPIRLLMFSTAIYAFLSITFLFDMDSLNLTFGSVRLESQEDTVPAKNLSDSISTDTLAIEEINSDFLYMDFNELKEVDTDALNKSEKESFRKAIEKEAGKEFMTRVSNMQDKLILMFVPIFALFTFLFFRKKGYNFVEHLVINSFLISVQNVVGILVFPILLFFPIVGSTVFFVVFLVFNIYYWMDVFQSKTFTGGVISVVIYLVSYILYVAVIAGFFIFILFKELNLE